MGRLVAAQRGRPSEKTDACGLALSPLTADSECIHLKNVKVLVLANASVGTL